MLFVDDDIVTINDLISLDPEVEEIAETDSIIISGNSGIIRRAKADIQSTVAQYMSFAGLSPHDLTVRNVNIPTTISGLKYEYAGFAQLVITGDSADQWSQFKSYAVAATLRKFYRAACNKKADRYSDRFDAINDEINTKFWPNVKRYGLQLCFNPLDAPGALGNRCGLFNQSNVVLVDGAGTALLSYDYAITWVGSRYVSPADKQNGESFRSARVSLPMENGKLAQISIAGLTPPNGRQPDFTLATCRYSPGVAVGWNVWACKTPSTDNSNGGAELDNPVMYRQNAALLPLTQQTFTLPGDPILAGETLDLGQYADIVLEINSEFKRC